MLDVDTFLVTVYCIVDDLYQARFAAQKPRRPGRKPKMTDSEVLTLAVLQQWQPDRSERAFLRYVRMHWRSYFPRPISQSAFNRRVRDLMGVLCQLGPAISQVAHGCLGDRPAYEVLDTVPVPLMRRCRGQRHRLFGQEAAIGRGGSDKDWYYGVSLLAAVSPRGLITGFVTGPANTEGRWLADAFLCWRWDPTVALPGAADLAPVLGPPHRGPRQGPTGTIGPRAGVGTDPAAPYLGDRGFTGAAWQAHWRQRYGAVVLTPGDPSPLRRLSRLRQIVETAFRWLEEPFGLQFPRARSRWGLLARLGAKVSAFNVAVHTNYLVGRPHFAFFNPLS